MYVNYIETWTDKFSYDPFKRQNYYQYQDKDQLLLSCINIGDDLFPDSYRPILLDYSTILYMHCLPVWSVCMCPSYL